VASSVLGKQDFCNAPLRRAERQFEKSGPASVWDRGPLTANSGSCAQMRLRGHHLGTAAALEGRKYSEAAEWTREDRLRQPEFLGLREDKSPSDVVRETAS
jgi:hypothetical protein